LAVTLRNIRDCFGNVCFINLTWPWQQPDNNFIGVE